MKLAGKTDVGSVRPENQDDYRAGELNSDAAWGLVCDGMGGVAGGSIASSVAVETYIRTLSDSDHPDQAVRAAVMAANSAIRQRAAGHPELSNVGDSRAYLAGAQGLRQISRDHSLVEDMVEKGDLTPGQARSHPRRNLITRALGPDPAVEADNFAIQWKAGDFLLLCSDGLVNTVTDQEIMFEILHNGQPEDCLQRLMAISKQRGAPDNVTAILLMND